MANGPIAERNRDATIYVGDLDEKCTESVLRELFMQSGSLVNVHMPKDRLTLLHQGYGFEECIGEEDADYAIKIMDRIKLYEKPIEVCKVSAHQRNLKAKVQLLAAQNPFFANRPYPFFADRPYQLFAAAPPMGMMPPGMTLAPPPPSRRHDSAASGSSNDAVAITASSASIELIPLKNTASTFITFSATTATSYVHYRRPQTSFAACSNGFLSFGGTTEDDAARWSGEFVAAVIKTTKCGSSDLYRSSFYVAAAPKW